MNSRKARDESPSLFAKCVIASLMATGLIGLFGCGVLIPSKKPSITPLDRREAIPADKSKVLPENDLYPPQVHLAGWQAPILLPGQVNTAGAEDSPFITPQGDRLFFFFTPDPNIPAEKQLGDGVTGIYLSRLQGDTWSEGERVWLQETGKMALDGCPFLIEDILWFCSAREGFTGINLFTAHLVAGKWEDVQYAGDLLRDYQTGEMHISPDGNELYFHSEREGGFGKTDIWVSHLVAGRWQEPENVVAINSPEVDGWPYISPDGMELWFTRFFQGSPAVFYSRRSNGQWSAPTLVVSQFAGEPTLDARGNLLFVHHYFKDGIMLEADIYIMYRLP